MAVRARLGTEIARRRLKQRQPIQVGWSLTERQVQSRRAAREATTLPQRGGDLAGISDFLRRLKEHQLVVLGSPGAGKSVLSMLLAWDFLQSTRPGEPVPVLLPLSSWRPTIKLLTWITRSITMLCPDLADERRFGKDIATRLIQERRVMLVLDGLDELPQTLHAKAVEEIDAAIADGLWALVTCRASEYESITRTGIHLTRAIAVELEAVTPEQAITYLEDSTVAGDDRWVPVANFLRKYPNSRLAKAFSSPLMLYLALTTYRMIQNDPRDLLEPKRFPTRAAIESHLLESYLHTVYAEPSGIRSRYQVDSARRYLTTVAQQMRRDRTFDFAWWQIDSRITGPLVGSAYGCFCGWLFFILYGPFLGISSGFVTGAAGYASHALVRRELRQAYIAEDAFHDPKSALHQYAGIGLLAGLISAGGATGVVALLLIFVLDAGAAQAWRHGLLAGSAIGLATLLGSTWGSYHVSRTWFWLTRRLPWSLLRFLDDAHALGVLRQSGAAYQFRHARLQMQLTRENWESPRSVRRTWGGKSHWKLLLPLVPSGAQIGLVMVGLYFVVGIFAGSNEAPLSYRSGTRPAVHLSPGCDMSTPGCKKPVIRSLDWTLRQGSVRETTLAVEAPREASFVGLGGSIVAHGCSGASVKVTLSLGDLALPAFVVHSDASNPDPLARKVPLPRAVRMDDQRVDIALRRLDDKTCDLSVRWSNASLVKDGLSPSARQRLGIAEPSDV
ncbi:NACHT domain-containing protein [Streptomyces sp. NPDC001832]|uniref:NACHT domain-containing protein n=1 Tax=Streptomyces sp. NPDC001832 TaxID=3154527 RepID=UPI00332B383D